MKKLLALLCLAPLAQADNYYEKTTIPPTVAAATILCNNTTAIAAPIQCTWVHFGSVSAPSTPAAGGNIYVDSNGAMHFQSLWYDATLVGGKYIGDATRPWFTTGIGFGHTVTSSGTNQPNIRIQKASSYTGASGALTLLDTLGASLTAQETAVTFQVICPTGNGSYDGKICVGLQVESDKNVGGNGNPFAGNFVAKDLTGSQLSEVAIESDVVASNPDTSRVRVINDVICREAVVQTLGLTSCGDGVRTRPSDNTGVTTGPTKLDHAFMAWTEASYPGAYIGDAFGSDGGAINGLNLSSKAIIATTLAEGVSGTATLTFDASTIPAASPGAWISDGAEAFIPASTTISSVSTAAGVTTITMSANQTGNVALGRSITITQAFDTGELLNGKFNVAARSVTTQYGLEETVQNGFVLGAATGGAKGVGTINATGAYVNNVAVLTAGTALANLATQATNTVVGNATSGTAVPTALPVGTCSTAGSALKWTTNTGFGCNTSIDAATLGSATFAAPGAIGGGTPAAGTFTTVSAGQITSSAASGTAPLLDGTYGVPYTLFRWGVPVILPSSGSFANNGALTLTTALPSNAACSATVGCYMYFPAGAIVAAGAAGVYYAQCSSTTACTVYNNVLASGVPVKITSPTAFATTGPGNYTQTTATQLTLITLAVPGNSMGPNGSIDVDFKTQRISNADSVAQQISFGGVAATTTSGTSLQWYGVHRTFLNLGATGSQVVLNGGANSASDQAVFNSAPSYLTADTTISRNIVFATNLGTAATDWAIVFGGSIVVNYAP